MNRGSDRRCALAAISGMLLLAAVGCANDLPLASKIAHLRALGGEVSVVNDQERSTPKPGEKADLTWSMAYPDPAQDDSQLASVFVVCTAPTQFTGQPLCQELLDVASNGDIMKYVELTSGAEQPSCGGDAANLTFDYGPFRVVCVTGTPKLNIAIEDSFKAPAKLVQGIICRNGTPQLDSGDPAGASCKPSSSSTAATREHVAVYGTVPVQYSDKDQNHNPSMAAASLLFHDPPLAWEPTADDVAATLSDQTCLEEAKAKRVMHTEGSEELITLRYDASAREQHDGKPEELEFSAYATFGKLDHRFAIFAQDAKLPLEDTFKWSLDDDERDALNGTSKRVRFYFTVLDHRGGFNVTTRDLCIDRQ